jgi:hypothetical protein
MYISHVPVTNALQGLTALPVVPPLRAWAWHAWQSIRILYEGSFKLMVTDTDHQSVAKWLVLHCCHAVLCDGVSPGLHVR